MGFFHYGDCSVAPRRAQQIWCMGAAAQPSAVWQQWCLCFAGGSSWIHGGSDHAVRGAAAVWQLCSMWRWRPLAGATTAAKLADFFVEMERVARDCVSGPGAAVRIVSA